MHSPAEAVHWLGAMQAQEYDEAKWSIAERLDGCTDADVEEAFARGEICVPISCGPPGTS